MNLDAIPESKAKSKARSVFAPSPYQAIERDFAFLVDATVGADEVLRAAKGAERNLIEQASIFDVYEGKGVPEGKKSLAIAVRIQPKDRTLTEPEIEALAQKIVGRGDQGDRPRCCGPDADMAAKFPRDCRPKAD